MAEKIKYNAVFTFCVASVLFRFTAINQNGFIFPRDRIYNLFISAAFTVFIIVITRYIDISSEVFKYILFFFIALITVYNHILFSSFYSSFHGVNSGVIALVTIVLFISCIIIHDKKLRLLYPFFIMINIAMIALILILAANKINVINIYSSPLDISFKPSEFFFFYEILIIQLLLARDKHKVSCEYKFLGVSVILLTIFTLLQGLSIKGEAMYSISPLQSLFQIFSSETIKRFDYIFSNIQAFNYYAAVILSGWCVQHIKNGGGGDRCENI